jgi:hypothetical protein
LVLMRRREGRGREEEKKNNGHRCQTRNIFGPCIAPSARGGGQDLSKTTLKDGIGWLDSPACVIRTVQGSSTRMQAPTYFFNNV